MEFFLALIYNQWFLVLLFSLARRRRKILLFSGFYSYFCMFLERFPWFFTDFFQIHKKFHILAIIPDASMWKKNKNSTYIRVGFYYETGRGRSWIPNFWNILYKKLHGDMFICIVLTCFECQFIFSLTKNSVSENSDPKPEPNLVPAEPIWFRLEPIWFRLQKFSSECYFRHFRVPDWSEIILGVSCPRPSLVRLISLRDL